jgi:uncharacterized protein (DUF427 family)
MCFSSRIEKRAGHFLRHRQRHLLKPVRIEERSEEMKAIWNNTVLAESEETIVVEGNHYFPAESVRQEFLRPSETHTTCGWKGVASYYSLEVGGDCNRDAAWYYPNPLPEAARIAGRIAFWRGVRVTE